MAGLECGRPTVQLLMLEIPKLVEWKRFGCLLGYTYDDMEAIQAGCGTAAECTLKLFSEWLSVSPSASWSKVVECLHGTEQHTLAEHIQREYVSSLAGAHGQLLSTPNLKDVEFHSEETVTVELKLILVKFAELVNSVKKELIAKEIPILDLRDFVQGYLHLEQSLTSVSSVDELFDMLQQKYYCFLNFEIVQVVINSFVGKELSCRLDEYNKYLELFLQSNTVGEFKDQLEQAVVSSDEHPQDMCSVVIIAVGSWFEAKINSFRKVLKYIFEGREKVFTRVRVRAGPVYFSFLAPCDENPHLLAMAVEKKEFLSLVGITCIEIDDATVFSISEDPSFSFSKALHSALCAGCDEAVRFLLEIGIDPNTCNDRGETGLRLSSDKGHTDMMGLFLDAGADPNASDFLGYSALHLACRKDKYDTVCALLRYGANPNPVCTTPTTMSPLMLACKNCSLPMVELLLQYHAQLKLRALLYVLRYKYRKDIAVKLLDAIVREGIDLNIPDKKGSTALLFASRFARLDMVELLIRSGADANTQNKSGSTALMVTVKHDCCEIAKMLLQLGADANIQDHNGSTALTVAVRYFHLEIAKILIQSGADANIQDKHSSTALMLAVKYGHLEIAKILIQSGADANIQDDDGSTALVFAVEYGCHEIAKTLVQSGANANIQDDHGSTALMVTGKFDHLEMAMMLIQSGADVNIKGRNGSTALAVAVKHYRLDFAKILIQSGAGVNIQDDNGSTALVAAVKCDHFEIAKILIQAGANANIQDRYGLTALIITVMHDHLEMAMMLIQSGADVNIKGRNGSTALVVAVQHYRLDFAKILIQSGAGVNIQDDHGSTALIVAVVHDCVEIAKMLIQFGADANIQNEHGSTTLIIAVERGHLEMTRMLIWSGANANIQDRNGLTALIAAVLNGHLEIAKILIQSGANTNIQNKRGSTALIAAVMYGRLQIAKILIQSGANIDHLNNVGLTPLAIASKEGCVEILELLAEASVDVQDEDGKTALIHAASQGQYKAVRFLLQLQASVNLQANTGTTALSLAARRGHTRIVEELLQAGANVNMQDKDGFTLLMFSIMGRNVEVSTLLIKYGAGVNFKSASGLTALALAVDNSLYEIVQLLVGSGADLNIRNADESTALIAAIEHRNFDIAKLLVNSGADLDIQDDNGSTALTKAIQNNSAEVANVLIRSGACLIGVPQPDILGFAIRNGDDDIVKIILQQKETSLDSQDQNGFTALMHSANEGRLGITRLFLQAGANVNSQSCSRQNNSQLHTTCQQSNISTPPDKGWSALMLAASRGHVKVVRLLLESGADANLQSYHSKSTALHLAVTNSHTEIVHELALSRFDSGASASTHDKIRILCDIYEQVHSEKSSSLQLAKYEKVLNVFLDSWHSKYSTSTCNADILMVKACTHDDKELASCVLQSGHQSRINVPIWEDFSYLVIACIFNSVGVAEVLISAGADVNVRITSEEITPFTLAMRLHDISMAVLLLQSGARVHKHALPVYSDSIISSLVAAVEPTVQELFAAMCFHAHKEINMLFDDCRFRELISAEALLFVLLCFDQRHGSYGVSGATKKAIISHVMQSPNTPILAGISPLMISCSHVCTEIVRDLLTATVNVNAQDSFGMTALFYAASSAKHDPCGDKYLQTYPVLGTDCLLDPHLKCFCNKHTTFESLRIIQLLLSAEASPIIRDCDGETALDVAATLKYERHEQLCILEELFQVASKRSVPTSRLTSQLKCDSYENVSTPATAPEEAAFKQSVMAATKSCTSHLLYIVGKKRKRSLVASLTTSRLPSHSKYDTHEELPPSVTTLEESAHPLSKYETYEDVISTSMLSSQEESVLRTTAHASSMVEARPSLTTTTLLSQSSYGTYEAVKSTSVTTLPLRSYPRCEDISPSEENTFNLQLEYGPYEQVTSKSMVASPSNPLLTQAPELGTSRSLHASSKLKLRPHVVKKLIKCM